jgi:hypothetical protein
MAGIGKLVHCQKTLLIVDAFTEDMGVLWMAHSLEQ